MPRKYLISETGKFYKTNLHCHTTNSDGRMTPAEIKEMYKELGYSVVAYTDHRVYIDHSYLNDDSFLALGGYEFDVGERSTERCYHLNAYAPRPEAGVYIGLENPDGSPMKYDLNEINRYIKRLTYEGYLVMYNHPVWSLQSPQDFIGLENVFAMEIYNHLCEMENRTGWAESFYSLMLRSGNYMYCTATDDNHNMPQPRAYYEGSGGGWVMIKSPALEYGAIFNSLREGQFYSSMGPEIYSLYIEDDKICCDCSPVQSAYMLTKNRKAKSFHDENNNITHVEFPFDRECGHVRLELFDAKGKAAFTNPHIV